jgi:threonine dehydrogenase-like Zn-dependent dehydrogenase
MKGAVLFGPRDVRYVERQDPMIVEPTDAILRLSATCVCGSDLWPYRGIDNPEGPTPMGHEYCGVVEEVGSAVKNVRRGQFVVGSFFASDNTCEICRAGYQSRCVHAEPIGREGAQAPFLRVPLADGTLVATPELPSDDLVPSLLSASDVLGTGWFGAHAAAVEPGKTVVIVGDGAVGLCAVIAARHMGAERIIMMSRHEDRQRLALEFGATDIVTERGNDGVARIKDMTRGLGAHSVIEAVGTEESMMQAIRSGASAASSAAISSASSVTSAAATFSSRRATRFVPGMGTMSGPRCIRQESAICPAVAPYRPSSSRTADAARMFASKFSPW